MNINPRIKDRFIQIFIASMLGIILIAYYHIELSSYPYYNYKMADTLFKKHDAELNESIVLTRFGIMKQYDSVVESVVGLKSTLALLEANLKTTPNPELSKKLQNVKEKLHEKEKLITEFERLNPVVINATHDFSNIMSQIIESETQADIVERFSIQNYNPDHYEFLNKLNTLFKNMLIYTSTPNDELYRSLSDLITTIKNDPIKVNNVDLALKYAETILSYSSRLIKIDSAILLFPILEELNKLTTAYDESYETYSKRVNLYQYAFYILSILLLIIVHFAFKRLQNIVQALDESNQLLEQRVAQRTQDLATKNEDLNKAMANLHDAQDQLIVQEKMASIGMLTTGIAHEIKNPLNFINNFSELSSSLSSDLKTTLEKEKSNIPENIYLDLYDMSSDLESNCSKIKQYGTRADNIVNSMLMHSKESSAQKEMAKIHPLIDNAADLAIHSYKTQNATFQVQLEKEYDSSLDKVFAAPPALSQVFVSILNNACWAVQEKLKSDPQFNPIIYIKTQKKDQVAILTFSDNGIGIPEKNILKIFEPFFTTRPTGFGNTGLGLSIAYDIITKQHKGEFSVTSTPGKHTEFTIKIPINPQDHL